MKYIALALCFAFTFYCFRREQKRSPFASLALIIPTLWMLRCASRGIDAWFAKEFTEEADVTRVDTVFIFLVAVAGFFVLLNRAGRVAEILRENRVLVLFYAYITISVVWSPIPFDSSKRLFRSFGDVTMALILATEVDAFGAMLSVFRRVVILLVPISLVLCKYYPAMGRLAPRHSGTSMWIGVATHKNSLGQFLMLAGFIVFLNIITAKRENGWNWFKTPFKLPAEMVYAACIARLFSGDGNNRSSTAILTLLMCIAMFFVLECFASRPRLVLPFLVIVLIAGVTAQAAAEIFAGESLRVVVAETQGRDATLKDRTVLWADVVRVANENWLLGQGFGGFWTPQVVTDFATRHPWGPKQSHNGYVETYAQLGLVGLALLLLVAAKAIVRAARSCAWDFDYGRFRVILLIAALFENYSEAGFPRPTHFVFFTFLIFAVNRPPPLPVEEEPVLEASYESVST